MPSILEKICNRALSIPAVCRVVRPIARRYYATFHPQFIVQIDGGLCSQIRFYLVGRYFAEMGYDVSYNLDWFTWAGMDNNGVFVRNFELTLLNKDLPFRAAPRLRSIIFRHCLYIDSSRYDSNPKDKSWTTDLNPPMYVGRFYHDTKEMYTRMLPAYFPYEKMLESLDKDNMVMLEAIRSCPSVAIHVRRGDLATFNVSYGEPCSVDYFSAAVNYLTKDGVPLIFYIFSDEPEWCRTELLKHLPPLNQYKIVDLNGSDRGYMDLLLMASCTHVITSKGSLGKYAALINPQPNRIVTLCDDDTERYWSEILVNSVLIRP